MGLDMYLEGDKFYWQFRDNGKCFTEDGHRLVKKTFELGYWRKHPNLHGFIVENFGGGIDECQRICLSEENLKEIIRAVKEDRLPETQGFFFGESGDPNDQNTIEQLEKAIKWLQIEEENVDRDVYYQASW